MKVLITGGTGFVGRHVLPLLAGNGWEIHAVTSKQKPESDPLGIVWHRLNLFDACQVDALVEQVKPTHLLHLAWYTETGKFWTSPTNLDWVIGSLSLLSAFRKHCDGRIVMAGTCAEYDWTYGLCNEGTTPCTPASIYGIAKHNLYNLCSAFASQAKLSFACGRIFFLYGPGEPRPRLVPSIICPLLEGKLAQCSHGRQVRDFLHVQDVAAAFVALLKSEVTGAVNIGSGDPTRIETVVSILGELLGRPDLIQFGAIPTSDSEPKMILSDSTRLAREVGWQPRFNLRDGLQDTVQWWRQVAQQTNQFCP